MIQASILRDLLGFLGQALGMCSESAIIQVQGRRVLVSELEQIQQLIDEHPDWSRHRIAKELCRQWHWQTPLGQLKTIAARELLLKLAQRHGLRLPAVREAFRRNPWGVRPSKWSGAAPAEPIQSSLESLQPLEWSMALKGSAEREKALGYLQSYHYLGCNRPVGAHLLYLVQDARQRDLAVQLVGAAAWQCAPRDRYIGWSPEVRARHLHRIANHSRFLILPWVVVPHLASHLLSSLIEHVALDWPQQQGWSLELLESFVEIPRFGGTAYRAAQWQEVGQTTGRTRQEKEHVASAPRKSVWVYGLRPGFKQRLSTLDQED